MSRLPDNRTRPLRTLTIPQVLVFYSIFILTWWFAWLVFRRSALEEIIFGSGLYGVLLIPVAYIFDSRVFSQEYWRFSQRGFLGIAVIATLQVIFESCASLPPTNSYAAFGAIVIAPFVEEFARAVMICPLMARLGSPAGLAVTALLWAWPHDFFWIALAQQSILCLIFVYTRKSLPAVIAAHFAMNVIATWHIGLRAHPLINVLSR
jgi:hypothetical protein